MQDAPIERIAKEVGIARGLIYRQFSSKEELFVLTVTDYLEELDGLLATGLSSAEGPRAALARCMEAFAGFCRRYPAFLDSSMALMRRPARDLRAIVSESVWLRLGQGMAACLSRVADVLREGAERGEFRVEDADYTANVLWVQALGAMQIVRSGVGVRQVAPGIPELFRVDADEMVRVCVRNALASVDAAVAAEGAS